jgi:hypothetical protein
MSRRRSPHRKQSSLGFRQAVLGGQVQSFKQAVFLGRARNMHPLRTPSRMEPRARVPDQRTAGGLFRPRERAS